MGKILVPLDVNVGKTSREALALARDLAKAQGSQLILMHVIEQVPGYVAGYLPADFRVRAIEVAVETLREVAKAEGLSDDVDFEVREGSPSAEILEYAGEIGADMIVVASHDPGFADYLLGSVAARVVRHAHCSVLVVRHAAG